MNIVLTAIHSLFKTFFGPNKAPNIADNNLSLRAFHWSWGTSIQFFWSFIWRVDAAKNWTSTGWNTYVHVSQGYLMVGPNKKKRLHNCLLDDITFAKGMKIHNIYQYNNLNGTGIHCDIDHVKMYRIHLWYYLLIKCTTTTKTILLTLFVFNNSHTNVHAADDDWAAVINLWAKSCWALSWFL